MHSLLYASEFSSRSTGAESASRSTGAESAVVSLASCIPTGRLIELSAARESEIPGARTTTAVTLLREAQRAGETTAWIQPEGGTLFPPDLSQSGIDLDALIVVHVPPIAKRTPFDLCKAAEILLRSGAFGFVVVDFCEGFPPGGQEAWQGRLLGLARQHECRVLLLTEKPAHESSLGPRVSVRVETQRIRQTPGRFVLNHRFLKNKSGMPHAVTPDLVRSPWGLK